MAASIYTVDSHTQTRLGMQKTPHAGLLYCCTVEPNIMFSESDWV